MLEGNTFNENSAELGGAVSIVCGKSKLIGNIFANDIFGKNAMQIIFADAMLIKHLNQIVTTHVCKRFRILRNKKMFLII